MKRNQLNFWIDTLTLLAMLGLLATGWIIYYTLPAGSGGHGHGAAWSLWGWSRHDWGSLHFWLAVGTVGLLLVHIALHWSWICAMAQSLWPRGQATPRRLGPTARTLLGMSVLVLFVGGFGLFAWIAEVQAHKPVAAQAGPNRTSAQAEPGAERGALHDEHEIRGYMTLEEVAATSGVALHDLRERLNLPESIPDREKIGRLRKERGLDVAAIREAVVSLKRAPAAR